MVKFASEILINFLKFLRNIKHLCTERNALLTLNATVSPGIIINQAEILHCTGLRVPHHVCNVVLGKAVNDVNAMRAWHAIAAAGAVVSQKCPVCTCDLTDDFLIIIGDYILG